MDTLQQNYTKQNHRAFNSETSYSFSITRQFKR